jgi:predicted MPP superfamily phosphohydrolase
MRISLAPQQPIVERVLISLPSVSAELDGITIAQLSDLHYDRRLDSALIEQAVSLTNALRPDLVVLTGDYLTVRVLGNGLRPAEDSRICARMLGQLHAPLGTFAVLGNHDCTDPRTVIRALENQGIAVLHNRNLAVEHGSGRLWIVGVEDVLLGQPSLDDALRGVPQGELTILLAHEPDFADVAAESPIKLQLSGHSHGGQVRFPFMGALYLPPMGRKYPPGISRIGPLVLYTNRGIGTSLLPIRLNCPPEITLFTLRSCCSLLLQAEPML